MIDEQDRWHFNEGRHSRLHEVLGAIPTAGQGDPGRRFAVWAPSIRKAWVIGDFNDWSANDASELEPQGSSGMWAGIVPNAEIGHRYRYRFLTQDGTMIEKADPFAAATELPPATASVVTDLRHEWQDADWLDARGTNQRHDQPISIYELHVGSWRHPEAFRSYNWNELADPLADHVLACGFTHVELMPIMEHPFYGSWGYQTTGFFAPTARYGTPQEFMEFIDAMHQRGIGVILDWVPSHFPADDWGLANFDGTHLFEHADPREGWHPDWKSYIFNYGRHEVRSFLISSALAWIERYHVDGIRVDAVASMLYRDYSRESGEWIPNEFGGRENLEAVAFLRQFNETLGFEHPDVLTIAEESTAWPGVTRPVGDGGLGFHYKWDMGWMHDTLEYFSSDPVHRRYRHGEITFRGIYAFSENYVLPLSHDEVTHGKGSILAKMPGDEWSQFANLRVLYANQWLNPGKKLMFMGQEFGQGPEWDHDTAVPWYQIGTSMHAGVLQVVTDLNALYKAEPALHKNENVPAGFAWIVLDDGENSVLVWERTVVAADPSVKTDPSATDRPIICVFNHTPVPRQQYRFGVPHAGDWQVLLNTDDAGYGGSGYLSERVFTADSTGAHGRQQALSIDLPPLSAVVLAPIL